MEIWIGRDGERHGPYKEDEVRQWLQNGQVKPSDLAWREGLADWQPLSVLFPDVTPAAAPPADTPFQPLPQTTAAALEDYAGFWKRVAAYILDAIILWIPSTLVEKLMGGDAAKEALTQAATSAAGNIEALQAAQMHYYATMWPAMAVGFLIAWMYYAFCESSAWQATIGKLALGIRVTDMNGHRISLGRSLRRYPAMILSSIILLIGFLMVAFTRRKQGLHDMIAGTLVLNGRASEFNDAPAKGGNNSFNA